MPPKRSKTHKLAGFPEGVSWANLIEGNTGRPAPSKAVVSTSTKYHSLSQREEEHKMKEVERILKAIDDPHEGDLVYDIETPNNTNSYRIYSDGDWHSVLNAHGDYNGPYPDTEKGRRALLGNPRYREDERDIEEARTKTMGSSAAKNAVVREAMEEMRDKIPAGREANAEKGAREALNSVWETEKDPKKRMAKARRGITVAMKAAAAAKGGARRTHRRRAAH